MAKRLFFSISLATLILAIARADEPKTPERYLQRAEHDPNGTGKFYMGREIALVMGHQAASWLDRPEREKEERPDKLLEALKLEPNQTVADIGAGSGYYVFRMAPIVSKGKVFAVDIQPEMIDIINKRKQAKGVANVEAILSDVKDPKLPAGRIDVILMVDVYHEFEFPYEMTEKLIAALKPGGKLVFVEFKKEDPGVPIKEVHKMSQRQVLKEMGAFSELDHIGTDSGLPWQHIIRFQKKTTPEK